jgi:hypothetical protein
MVKITATIATRVALSAAPSTSRRQATSSITGGMMNSTGRDWAKTSDGHHQQQQQASDARRRQRPFAQVVADADQGQQAGRDGHQAQDVAQRPDADIGQQRAAAQGGVDRGGDRAGGDRAARPQIRAKAIMSRARPRSTSGPTYAAHAPGADEDLDDVAADQHDVDDRRSLDMGAGRQAADQASQQYGGPWRLRHDSRQATPKPLDSQIGATWP